jgi:hypothetical protein
MRQYERDRRVALWLLCALIALLAVFRLEYVQMGPDPDTDSYGHHAISRQLAATPALFSIHWVWLPLFHYLQAAAITFGATLDTMRYANVAATAALPLVLFAVLGRGQGLERVPTRVLVVACGLTAASPIVQQMGTTGQPEPLFALLTLGFVWAMDRDRYPLAGLALGAASLVRYEAWAIIVMTAGWLMLAWLRPTLAAKANRSKRPWFVVFMAVSAIVFWAILRWPSDGAWFAFLNQTRAFANDAVGASSSFTVSAAQFVTDVGHYTVYVPWRLMGPLVLLAPFGLKRTWNVHGPWFFAASLGCLGFITMSWVTRSSLGLDRHFFVIVPFYATLIAHGIEGIVQLVNVLVQKATSERPVRALSGVVFAACAIACASVQAPIAEDWMHEWGGAVEYGHPTPYAAAAFLDSNFKNAPAPLIFCDESTVELLSHLDRTAFERHQLDDPKTLSAIRRAQETRGAVYVASWMARLKKLRKMGKLIYQTPEATETRGLGVLRIEGVNRSASDL